MTIESETNHSPQAEIDDFLLVAGRRTLLESANAKFAKGKITLIVGPSGVGKSLLLKILSGIQESSRDGIHFEGKVEIEGSRSVAGKAAVVFQNFAKGKTCRLLSRGVLSLLQTVRFTEQLCGPKR